MARYDGTEGNDHILGTNGNDKIWGYAGNDYLDGSDGRDTIYGGNGHDIIHGERVEGYTGSPGGDKLYGGKGNDQLIGYNGSDTLKGGSGKDVIAGDEGNDLLYGGSGKDTFVFIQDREYEAADSFLGVDIIYDYEAKDRLLFSDNSRDLDLTQFNSNVLISSGNVTVFITNADIDDVRHSMETSAGFEDVLG